MIRKPALPNSPPRHVAARTEVGAALSNGAPLRQKFESCTEAVVRHLDAAAARLWLVTKDRRTLALQANSGAPATPGGGEPHIPVMSPALRSIVEAGLPYVTNDAVHDPHLKGLHWAPGDHMAYAGYPLLVDAEVVGVLAMFSRTPIGRSTLETLCTIADMIAETIQRTRDRDGPHQSDAFLTEARRLGSLFDAARHAIHRNRCALEHEVELQVLRDRYAMLSRRERQVMALVVAGRLNKQVGAQLGISEITVKAHRGQVMRKMRAFSLADLVKIAMLLQLLPPS